MCVVVFFCWWVSVDKSKYSVAMASAPTGSLFHCKGRPGPG